MKKMFICFIAGHNDPVPDTEQVLFAAFARVKFGIRNEDFYMVYTLSKFELRLPLLNVIREETDKKGVLPNAPAFAIEARHFSSTTLFISFNFVTKHPPKLFLLGKKLKL